ncbi:hypothetical protein PT277_04575 [Acetobacteraceae bacterium ESL0709]|nr:hypothetical protein [Acetobacteraceae bacterium ESL0697]MDF7677971.1 hypothetical protein [Acetobacteraceae bacterium ESL0709]
MSIFLAKNEDYFGFYDDRLGSVPPGAIEINETVYAQLLTANTCGATLSVRDNVPVALNWDGTEIDLTSVTASSNYHKPLNQHAVLKAQAMSALAAIQSQAPMIVAMGENFGEKTKAYVKALNAIIDGTDTISSELPVKPEKLTD